MACRARWEPGATLGRQWGAYLHGVGHVVVRCVIDAGEEVLTQLWTEETEGCSCLGCPDHGDFYLLTPKNRAPECWDSPWGVGRTPPRTDIGGSASPETTWCPAGPVHSSSQQAQPVGARHFNYRYSQIPASCSQTGVHPVLEGSGMTLLVPSPSGRPCQLAGAAGLW